MLQKYYSFHVGSWEAAEAVGGDIKGKADKRHSGIEEDRKEESVRAKAGGGS